jgi:sarcosine oxidase delta subunit
LFVERVQSNRCACPTCADRDSDGYTICKHARSNEDDNTNVYEDSHMDKYAYPDNDPDITTDKDGHAWIHVNGRAYRYEYADTSGAGSDEDTGDADAVVTKFRYDVMTFRCPTLFQYAEGVGASD